MIRDVKVVEGESCTEIEISSLQLLIRYDKENLEIVFKGNRNNSISLEGNTKLGVKGDFYVVVDGEMGIVTNGEPLHLDSLNSGLYLNSRVSKMLKNLPESIECSPHMAFLNEFRDKMPGLCGFRSVLW